MSYQQNIIRIKVIHAALGDLSSRVVYVGGATVALYASKPTGEIRPTDDVDILIELIQYSDFTELDIQLRKKGFINDVDSGVICRYKIQGVIVDFMPTKEYILGFSNIWYHEGFHRAQAIKLDNECTVRIFQPVYFLASKLEAFRNRGDGDGRTSSDFEDIVFLLHNRNEIWNEITTSGKDIHNYIIKAFKELSANKYLSEWISAHLSYHEQDRVTNIEGGIYAIASGEST